MKRLLAVVLTLAVLCALFFVIFEADHDCTGENCQICCVLSACIRTLRLLGAVLLAAAVLPVSVPVCGAVCRFAGAVCRTTLITQKVKLSN